MQKTKKEKFKKELMSLLEKYQAEMKTYDKPRWPECDPERGVGFYFYNGEELEINDE